MEKLPTRLIPRRWFLYLAVLGPIGFGVANTLGCEEVKPETAREGFDYWFADELLKLTNDERIERDFPPLLQHSGLIETAKEHAQELAQNNHLSEEGIHESLDGSSHIDRIVRRGFDPNLRITENANHGATGRSAIDKPSEYHEDFMDSDKGHRENILNPKLELVGIGCYVKNSTRWCVIDFVGVP